MTSPSTAPRGHAVRGISWLGVDRSPWFAGAQSRPCGAPAPTLESWREVAEKATTSVDRVGGTSNVETPTSAQWFHECRVA